jgi:uncharacterized membrane protein HdeD (DUF308 family)
MADETNQTESGFQQKIKRDFPFLVAIYRGLTAIVLGIVLLINPEKSSLLLANYMGFFWISSGLILLRRDSDIALESLGKRTSLIIGFLAILSGLLVVTRRIAQIWVDQALVVQLLGIVILLTGVLHALSQFRILRARKSGATLAHVFLGLFEILLGGMLFASPLDRSPLGYLVAMVWALVGGVMILGSAVFDRFRSPKPEEQIVD